MKNTIRKTAAAFLLTIACTLVACGGGGDSTSGSSPNPSLGGGGTTDGGSASSNLTGLAAVKLDLDGAIGLALVDPNNSSGFTKSVGAGDSNLGRVNQDNTLSNAITSGSMRVQSFMVAPDNNVYLLLSEPIDSCSEGSSNLAKAEGDYCQPNSCILVRIKGTNSEVTNEITCVDYTLRSVNWSNGFNEPIQFDGAGNIYYMGRDADGKTVLRENADGVITDLINEYINLNEFVVLYDGTVFISGSSPTGVSWTRIISPDDPDQRLQDFFDNQTSFLIFPDNNIYFSDWTRYLTATKTLDSRPWLGNAYDENNPENNPYHVCPEGVWCTNIGSIFRNIDGGVFGISGSVLMQYYPDVLEINTTISNITVHKGVLSHIILAGSTGSGAAKKHKLILYNTTNDTETNLLGNENIEVYHVNYLTSNSSQIIMFDGLRFSDNNYVLCRVDLTNGNTLLCSKTGAMGQLTDFQLFNNTTIVGGLSSDKKTYLVGGSVSGLYGNLVLSNNDSDFITLTGSGSFTFPIAVNSGYDVKVETSPDGQSCAVIDGTGAIADHHIDSIRIECTISSGHIVTVAGGGDQRDADGVLATKTVFSSVDGINFDSNGNLYVAVKTHNKVKRIDRNTGIITTVAGTGTSGFSGDGAQATNAKLNYPSAIAIDSQDNLYILDQENYRVRKVTVAGVISTVAGIGVAGYSGDGGAATNAKLGGSFGIAIDSSDNLFLADTGNSRIRKIDVATGIITTVAGSVTTGYSGDGGQATSAAISEPRGLAFDSAGNMYVADTGNSRIRKVDLAGIITTVAGTGSGGYSGDGGLAINAQINIPFSVAFDSSDNYYIADANNNVIRKASKLDGKINTVAGIGIPGLSGDGSLAILAETNYPWYLAVDSYDNIYFTDTNNVRIREVGK